MINIRSRNDDHEVDIRFPISESELYAKLAEIHAIDGRDAPPSAFVTEVYWPEELSTLKDRFANLDELNYLAKRMESFDYNEYDQFLIGITKLENPTEKDLINLTFNLDHFTLCKDVSSYGKIGREYVLNTEGAVPANDEDDPKYAAIGKDLIDRGLAQITAKGLLIYNPFDELTEVYDGQTFPEYYYESTLASAEVSYNGRTELLLLPGEEIAIRKAITRLGAPSDSDCDMLRTQTEAIAKNFKIPVEDLKWYAAFHNESHHPHVHLMVYSSEQAKPYLTQKGIMNLRSAFAKDVFADDLLSIYEKQTAHRNALRAQSRDVIAEIVSRINSGAYDNPALENKLLELADRLSKTSGKKQYGYLKADVKALVNGIVSDLAADELIASLYDLWYEQREEVIRTYTEELPERIPLVDNPEFKSIKNMVIQEALNIFADRVFTDE